MRIVALVKSLENVCARYRVAAFRPFLEQAGHTLDIRPWPRPWLSRLLWRRELGSADVLLIQRRMPPVWQLTLLRRVAGCLIFDFDDAIFTHDSFTAPGLFGSGRAAAFRRTIQAVDLVVAGNPFLREQALLWKEANRVHLIPTCVDVSRYPLAEHRANRPVQLVWIGSSSTLPGLQRLAPTLEQLGRALPGVSLKIICDRFFCLSSLRVVPCPWSEKTECAELASADIGISWLEPDLWSQGKCGLKVLQYGAAGLPVVANPIGMHQPLVQPGKTGFLVTTPQELMEAVQILAANSALRQRLGAGGREVVAGRFDVPVGARLWLALLERVPALAGRMQ